MKSAGLLTRREKREVMLGRLFKLPGTRLLLRTVAGTLLLAAALVCLGTLWGARPLTSAWMREVLARLNALPDTDFVPEIRELRKNGRLQEALELARFVRRHPDLPGQDEAARLEKEIDAELHSLHKQIERAVRGFLTGKGNSAEAMAGAVVSDMIVYGDFRDLAVQAAHWMSGDDADPVTAALAALGLLTETVDAADWGPAVLKAFRKAGALTDDFARWLVRAARRSVRARRLDDAVQGVFGSLRRLVQRLGLGRTAEVLRHTTTPEDLAVAARLARRDPEVLWILVHGNGRAGLRVADALSDLPQGGRLLERAALKGPRGAELLQSAWRRRMVHAARATRLTARVLKAIRLGHIQGLLLETARRSAGVRTALGMGFVLFTLLGLSMLAGVTFEGTGSVGKLRTSRRPNPEDAP